MAIEIERKFLVAGDAWRGEAAKSTRLRQGYLQAHPERNVRVRTKGERAMLTVKGAVADGSWVERLEFEYEVPLEDAEQMLELCEGALIEKTRHEVELGGFLWEIDEFSGDNAGLVVAEIELPSADTDFERPDWLGEEVSEDPRYLNANLISRPYRSW